MVWGRNKIVRERPGKAKKRPARRTEEPKAAATLRPPKTAYKRFGHHPETVWELPTRNGLGATRKDPREESLLLAAIQASRMDRPKKVLSKLS